MNLTVLKCNPAGEVVDSEGHPVPHKRSVLRNLGRLEQIFSCAERLLTRCEADECPLLPATHGEIKKV
jgi:hypothetical protein